HSRHNPTPEHRTNPSEHPTPSGIAPLGDRDRHGIEGLERPLWNRSRVRNGEIVALHALLSHSPRFDSESAHYLPTGFTPRRLRRSPRRTPCRTNTACARLPTMGRTSACAVHPPRRNAAARSPDPWATTR